VLRLSLAILLALIGFHAYVATLPLALVAAGMPDALIGVVMGSAAFVQIAAALALGGFLDRFGGRSIYLLGCASFAAASLMIATGLAAPDGPLVPLFVVRTLQGIGFAMVLPSALTLVPSLVRPERLAVGLSLAGSAGNVALAIAPPVSLAIMDAASLRAVALVTLVCIGAGAVVMVLPVRAPARLRGAPGPAGPGSSAPTLAGPASAVPAPADPRPGPPRAPRSRAFRPAFRPSWVGPLAISTLFIVHWGVITGFLPQHVDGTGASIALFFTVDAVAILALRVPMGYLTDHLGTRPLMVAGAALTMVGVVALLPPPTTPLLVAAALGTGVGGALILPPLTVELAHRSSALDRGSAFALFSAAFAGGIAIGSIGGAPIVATLGFDAAIVASMVACAAALAWSWLLPPAPAVVASRPGATGADSV
jgi:MFS family permease